MSDNKSVMAKIVYRTRLSVKTDYQKLEELRRFCLSNISININDIRDQYGNNSVLAVGQYHCEIVEENGSLFLEAWADAKLSEEVAIASN